MTYTEKTMIKRLFWLVAAAALGLAIGSASAQTYFAPPEPLSCTQGSVKAITTGLSSTNSLQSSFPSCTVAVYLHGTSTLATIFSNSTGTSLSNPFTAPSNGLFLFYAAFGEYDVTLSAMGMATTTLADVTISAPFNGITGVFGGSPGIPFALTGSTSRAATITDLATLGAIVSGANCGGALSGTFPNCTIAGIGSAGSIPMSDGAGHLEPSGLTGNGSGSLELSALTAGGMVKATSPLGTLAIATPGTDYAPGTNPSGGQNNYAPLFAPSFAGGATVTLNSLSDIPLTVVNPNPSLTAIGESGIAVFAPNLTNGGASISIGVGISEANGMSGGLGFVNNGSAATNAVTLAVINPLTQPNGLCVNGIGQVGIGYYPATGCATTAELTVIGTVSATSYNGVALMNTGGGTSFLSNAGTYIPITAAGNPVDVTGSRTFGPGNIYQNTNAWTLQASGFGVAVTGTATNNIACLIGPTSPPTMIVFSQTNGATTIGGAAGFICPRIPATWFYEVNKTNDLSATPSSWIESPTI